MKIPWQSSSSARARMRREGCCRSVRWAPGFLPTITHGLSSARERAERMLTAAPKSGTIRASVFPSRSLISAVFRFTSPSVASGPRSAGSRSA